MIAAAAVLFGLAFVLAAVGASSLSLARRIAAERLTGIERREQALDVLRLSMENAHAERERMWAEERRELLDRIQAPNVVAARLADALTGADLAAAASDDEIDRRYADDPAAAVAWDPDLAPLAGIDPELAVAETGS